MCERSISSSNIRRCQRHLTNMDREVDVKGPFDFYGPRFHDRGGQCFEDSSYAL